MLEPYYYLMFWFNQNLKILFLALVIFFRIRAGKTLNFQRNDDVITNITWPLWFFLYFLRAFVLLYLLAKFHWFSIKSIGVRGVGHFCPPHCDQIPQTPPWIGLNSFMPSMLNFSGLPITVQTRDHLRTSPTCSC